MYYKEITLLISEHLLVEGVYTQLNNITFLCWYCFDNNLHQNCIHLFIKKIGVGTAYSNSAICDEFLSNISTKALKKHHILCPICTFLVEIKCKFNAHFGWKINESRISCNGGMFQLAYINHLNSILTSVVVERPLRVQEV